MAEIRAANLLTLCEKRGYAVGDFLTAEERAVCEAVFRAKKKNSFSFFFDGGVSGAERTVPVLLDGCNADLNPTEFSDIVLIGLQAAGNVPPDHRSVLGSLLGLGLERSAVGDIFCFEEQAVAAVKGRIAPYILSNLTRVGKNSVQVVKLVLPPDFEIERKTETLIFSVSSLRLDCLVAAVCRFSREEAAEYIKKGMVGIDHSPVVSPDRRVEEKSLLSLRGKGRFLLEGTMGVTKSGRLRVKIAHYL